jgi:K+ transporter
MKITDYMAVWGAVVATAVAVWNIYKDVLRDRVKIQVRFATAVPGRIDLFTCDVTNLTNHKIRVTHCFGYSQKIMVRNEMLHRILKPLAGPYLRDPNQAFFFLSRNDVGATLPGIIEPWDQATFCFNPENLPVIEEFFVITADSRKWFASRADIEAIHNHRLYKAARAAAAPSQGAE